MKANEEFDLKQITLGEPDAVSADMRKFNRAQEMVSKVVVSLSAFNKISSQEEADKAMEMMKIANGALKAVEIKRKALVTPYNNEASKINAFAKQLNKPIEEGIASVKQATLDFQKAEAERLQAEKFSKRKEALESMGFQWKEGAKVFEMDNIGLITEFEVKNNDDATFNSKLSILHLKIEEATKSKDDQDALDDVFSGNAVAGEPTPEVKIPAPPIPVNTTAAAPQVKGLTKRWTFKIADATLVPRQYLIVDETAIRKAIAAGERTIAGIEIFQEESISIR